ncbi:MAG TPA: bifunctional demethylmenaquinone methyltransferase/2-methoxy-6-polyprenyl-1,4-benzoquinol methylase UbiE [Kofleriaceae bacterium]|nr:bifunctional demethylmenaquinone methyltransferase/2-methoxy-6-polyprenyl-1,4-benzoquinol methylase UbiE [Kofleriaceae bacterium]
MSDSAAEQIIAPGSGAMFDAIAPRYDLLNRLMSFGVDGRWRRKTVRALALGANARVLDLATGTGDLAIAIAKKHRDARVVGVDPSTGMLAIGARKAARWGGRIEMREGDAQALAFDDGSFDAACIAFGIRNVPDRARGLAELRRVVRPGGRVCILELGEPRRGILGPLARFHVHHVVPRMGALISGKREYRYLQRSIAAFPPPDEFGRMMAAAGLRVVEIKALTFGVCHLYIAEVPA